MNKIELDKISSSFNMNITVTSVIMIWFNILLLNVNNTNSNAQLCGMIGINIFLVVSLCVNIITVNYLKCLKYKYLLQTNEMNTV